MRTERSTKQRLLSLVTGISATTLLTAGLALAAEQLPEFSRPTLTPALTGDPLVPGSQAAANFGSKAPNALASYYTYIPLSNTDAVALGFPSVCGNPNTVVNPLLDPADPDYTIHTPTLGKAPVISDESSTADCYVISLRQFSQPTSLEFLKFVLPKFPIPSYAPWNGTGLGSIGADLFPGQGLLNDLGAPFVRQDTFAHFAADSQALSPTVNAGNMTWAQGYGSGGKNWQPHYPNGPIVRGNAPWAFQTTPFNALFGAGNNGDPAATGIWHFPAPTIKGTRGRPVYVQWLNDLKNVWLEGFDPSNDCGHIPDWCYPFNREVVHVHGAHVGPESDGLATAWYSPNYALFGEGNFTMANYNWPGRTIDGTDPLSGQYIYRYPMDQEASTIWYHTHAVGVTHQNTNAGQAGFFPVTDAHEQSLIGTTLPNTAFEHGFAFQERHFDTTGEMRMPDIGRYDRTTPGCTYDAAGLPDPATCTRLNWMYAFGKSSGYTGSATNFADPTPTLHLVPYNGDGVYSVNNVPVTPTAPELINVGNAAYAANNPSGCQVDTKNRFKDIRLDGTPFVQCAPFPATETTLEYFGNIPVVNGVVNANYDLQTGQVHRMRFIGGTDSRTWVLQLVQTAGAECSNSITCDASMPNGLNYKFYNSAAVIPFWQIGSEQGLLNAPVKRDFIDLMSGERVDVLVDLTGIPAGTTVMLKNLGEDAPYTGVFDLGSAPSSVQIPEVMKFNVVADNSNPPITPSIRPSLNGTDPNPALVLRTPITVPTATAGLPIKNVALIEITDQYGNTMPTIDARGYIVPGMLKTEYMLKDTTEIWDIINTTVDAHPMHLHQVAFLTTHRFGFSSFNPPESNTLTQVFSQSSYTPGGLPPSIDPALQMVNGVSPWDRGWKDTIQSIPGYVQRVIATWDIPGEYVWHCHILSHEEHDMMRPSQIVLASAVAAPAWLGASANNGQGTIKLWWPAVSGATGYIIHESENNFTTSRYAVTTGPVTSAILKLKADGTYRYRIAAILPATSATDHPKQTDFRTMAGSVTLAKTVAAPAWVGANSIPRQNFIKVTFAASTTPNTFASDEGHLHYPVEYLVQYNVTVTDTVTPANTWTTVVTVPAGNGDTVVGAGVDPVTGAALPLPNGTYTVSIVATKASYKPSSSVSAASPVTVSVTNVAAAWLGAQKVGGTTGSVKLWWPTVPGQVMQIMDGATNVTPATIQISGTTSYVILTGVATGTHTYTIQNIAQPGITNPSSTTTSAAVTL